jgi:hypothetical protein
MLRSLKTPKLKHLTAATLSLLMGLYGGPVVAATDISPWSSSLSWRIDDRWYLMVEHHCNIEEVTFGFWPADPVCSGKLYAQQFSQPEPDPNDSFEAQYRSRLQSKTTDIANAQRQIGGGGVSVNGTVNERNSSEVYDRILALKDPVVSFAGGNYRLNRFSELASKDSSIQLDKAKAIVKEKRISVLLATLSALALIIFALFVLRWIVKRLLPQLAIFTGKMARKGARKSNDALEGLRTMRVRHVAMDETIRAATRKSLDISQKERADLRTQIAQALDAGNTELAKTLMSLLKKLEGDIA